ncbi:MAG: hypothetical protein QM764_22090 [Chitinophagaceae bacterium]
MKLNLFIAFLSIACISGFSQRTKIQVSHNENVITRQTVNIYNQKGKDAILNVNKYIDTSKPITIDAGANYVTGFIFIDSLKKGCVIYPLGGNSGLGGIRFKGGDKVISIKMQKGKLKISSEIMGFDQKYIAKIVDNKLITSKPDYHLYVSDWYFELFDDYYIPVIQIELVKKTNTISIGGVFIDDLGYTLMSKYNGITTDRFDCPVLLMRPAQRDSALYDYIKRARHWMVPIHE